MQVFLAHQAAVNKRARVRVEGIPSLHRHGSRLMATWNSCALSLEQDQRPEKDAGLGQVSPAYKAVDQHAVRRLRRWLCRKHKVKTGGYVRFSNQRLWPGLGLVNLAPKTKDLPWAKA